MSENRARRVGPDVEVRYQRLIVDGALRCPLCPRTVTVPPSGAITLRVFDQFRGHLMTHDVIEWVEHLHT